MATLQIAFVAFLATLTMGQNFQNNVGRFGVLPGIGGFRSGFGSGAFFGNGAALFDAFFTNERARVEGGCSSEGMGPVIQRLRPRFFGPANTRPGIIADLTLEQNREITIDVASLNMPFDDLESYAGIGFSICSGLTTDAFGRQVCPDPVFACCKLGYDNKEAVLLPIL